MKYVIGWLLAANFWWGRGQRGKFIIFQIIVISKLMFISVTFLFWPYSPWQTVYFIPNSGWLFFQSLVFFDVLTINEIHFYKLFVIYMYV